MRGRQTKRRMIRDDYYLRLLSIFKFFTAGVERRRKEANERRSSFDSRAPLCLSILLPARMLAKRVCQENGEEQKQKKDEDEWTICFPIIEKRSLLKNKWTSGRLRKDFNILSKNLAFISNVEHFLSELSV